MFAYEKTERSTFAAERLVKTTCGCENPRRITRADPNNAACRKLDTRLIRMPADLETRAARRSDLPGELRASGSQFRGRCAADPECLWPAAVFAAFLAAPGTQTLGRLCFVSSTHQPSLRTRVGRLILQR